MPLGICGVSIDAEVRAVMGSGVANDLLPTWAKQRERTRARCPSQPCSATMQPTHGQHAPSALARRRLRWCDAQTPGWQLRSFNGPALGQKWGVVTDLRLRTVQPADPTKFGLENFASFEPGDAVVPISAISTLCPDDSKDGTSTSHSQAQALEQALLFVGFEDGSVKSYVLKHLFSELA